MVLSRKVRSALGIPHPLEEATLLNRRFRVYPGAIRATADKDDAWVLACAAHSKTILDIGCNMGQAALVMLLPDTVERVILVDPQPEALQIAATNLIHNHLIGRASLECAFISDQDGATVTFWTMPQGAAGSMYADHAKSAQAAGASMEVPTLTIDTLVKRQGIAPDLIKIDIEGAEALALAGAVETVHMFKPRVFVELHSNSKLPMTENIQYVLDWCAQVGYRCWYLDKKCELIDPQQAATRGRFHVLLLPDSQPFPEWLQNIPQNAPLESVSW